MIYCFLFVQTIALLSALLATLACTVLHISSFTTPSCTLCVQSTPPLRLRSVQAGREFSNFQALFLALNFSTCQLFNFLPSAFLSATLNFALLDLGFIFNSSVPATTGFFVMIFKPLFVSTLIKGFSSFSSKLP